jgi:hypothetical protein
MSSKATVMAPSAATTTKPTQSTPPTAKPSAPSQPTKSSAPSQPTKPSAPSQPTTSKTAPSTQAQTQTQAPPGLLVNAKTFEFSITKTGTSTKPMVGGLGTDSQVIKAALYLLSSRELIQILTGPTASQWALIDLRDPGNISDTRRSFTIATSHNWPLYISQTSEGSPAKRLSDFTISETNPQATCEKSWTKELALSTSVIGQVTRDKSIKNILFFDDASKTRTPPISRAYAELIAGKNNKTTFALYKGFDDFLLEAEWFSLQDLATSASLGKTTPDAARAIWDEMRGFVRDPSGLVKRNLPPAIQKTVVAWNFRAQIVRKGPSQRLEDLVEMNAKAIAREEKEKKEKEKLNTVPPEPSTGGKQVRYISRQPPSNVPTAV